jgi:hypothetical protein
MSYSPHPRATIHSTTLWTRAVFRPAIFSSVDSPGVHHFRIRNAYGCEFDTTAGIFYTGIEEQNGISYCAISPNPASGIAALTIEI